MFENKIMIDKLILKLVDFEITNNDYAIVSFPCVDIIKL